MKIYNVTKDDFIEWFFTSDARGEFFKDKSTLDKTSVDKFKENPEKVFRACPYIPLDICKRIAEFGYKSEFEKIPSNLCNLIDMEKTIPEQYSNTCPKCGKKFGSGLPIPDGTWCVSCYYKQ